MAAPTSTFVMCRMERDADCLGYALCKATHWSLCAFSRASYLPHTPTHLSSLSTRPSAQHQKLSINKSSLTAAPIHLPGTPRRSNSLAHALRRQAPRLLQRPPPLAHHLLLHAPRHTRDPATIRCLVPILERHRDGGEREDHTGREGAWRGCGACGY